MQILRSSSDAAGARGWLWHVDGVQAAGRRTALMYLTRASDAGGRALVAVRPAEPVARVPAAGALCAVNVQQACDVLREAAQRERVAFTLAAAERLRGDIHPWQLAAAMAFGRGHSRVLLADAVGTGKTVSAAIAIAECLSEAPERRCLVIAPGQLTGQWREELRSRLGVAAVLLDAAELRRVERTLPAGVPAWSMPGCLLTPIDFVKQPHVARALTPLVWDLVVVDEAHLACGDSDRHAACAALARRARRLLLLSATPSDGGEIRIAALRSLGAAGEPLISLRHAPRDAVRARQTRLFVAPAASLAALHRGLDRYVTRITTKAKSPAVDLLAVLLQRRALSSAHALRLSLERRLALLGSGPDEQQLPLFDAEDEGHVLGVASGLALPDERDRLATLIDAAARAARDDRRLPALERLVTKVSEPVIVFTCFRDTALLLFDRLTPIADARIVHGQLPGAARDAALDAFVHGPARVLIATDVAAQGLNLQARCRRVIHYDLPWRPSTIRQREGRVDRMGQRGRTRATLLLDRLSAAASALERLQAFARRMDLDAPTTPARWRVLAGAEAARLRARRCGSGGPDPAGPLIGPTHAVETTMADAAGAVVERTCAAVAADREHALDWATRRARMRAAAIARRLRTRATRRIARERSVICAALESFGRPGQDGLFDRRAARQREANERACQDLARTEREAIAQHTQAGVIAFTRLRVIAAFHKTRRD